MIRVLMVLLVCTGCKKDGDGDPQDDSPVSPTACIVDGEVCMVFDTGWSESDAADECESYGGEPGDCPAEPMGECSVEDGITFQLYDMNPVDAAGYCTYLGGEWVADA